MNESNRWGLPRYMILLVVLTLHGVLLALLVMASRTRQISASAGPPIELLFIAPANPPKIRPENYRPPRLSGNMAPSIAPPLLHAISPSLTPATSGSEGGGSGVDWIAEARRAVQAFEIRSHRPSSNESVSRSPADDHWWPRPPHRASDQFRTPNGDWIVWINSSCYQIASAAASTLLPQTICPGEPSRPRGNGSDR